MPDQLDLLTNEIEQGFMQRGGWKACRYLLGKLVEDIKLLEDIQAVSEVERFQASVDKYERFANKFCPACDDCKSLLLDGGIALADGITKKPCRIVCPECAEKPQ